MITTSTEFVLLEQEANLAQGSQVLTRGLGLVLPGGEALLGIDSSSARHLLIPLTGESVPEDRSSAGVALTSRDLRTDRTDITYADLHCTDPGLVLVFERLADDVIERLSDAPDHPVSTCVAVLDEWRSLLKRAGSASRETLIGLIGELSILDTLSRRDPLAAFECWRGPSGSIHDFVGSSSHIEVKTSAVDRPDRNVLIAGVDQLDPSNCAQLYLAVLHLVEDPSAPTIDDRIDALVKLGVPQRRLIDTIADVGYVYETKLDFDTRLAVDKIAIYNVDSAFPSIRRSDFDPQRLRFIRDLKYSISLEGLSAIHTGPEATSFLDSWELFAHEQ